MQEKNEIKEENFDDKLMLKKKQSKKNYYKNILSMIMELHLT